jgi:hypothetical protein
MKGKNRMKRFKVQVYWPQPWAYQTCGHISYIAWHGKLSRMKKYCAFIATTSCKCWFKQLHTGECTLQCTQFEWNLEHIISKQQNVKFHLFWIILKITYKWFGLQN